MQKLLNLYKKDGETPLERLQRFRIASPEYKDVKLTYLGRLDPMAEGVLLVAVGDEAKNREKYLNLPKTYLVDVLWGFETDTYDILGLVKEYKDHSNFSEAKLDKMLTNFVGRRRQEYPPYSSKPLYGKPLFEHARKGHLSGVEIPSKIIEIYSIKHEEEISMREASLERLIIERISRVQGDFRQKKIIKRWGEIFEIEHPRYFHMTRLKIACSTGTYMRSIAHELGQEMKTGAIAYRIIREKVGEYDTESSIR